MSDSRRENRTQGFTMAELLTVVAILAVLMAIAGIAISNYLRDLTLNEYDNAAKSIYIAAQNNIADLQASGVWNAEAKEYQKEKAQSDGQTDGFAYYYVTSDDARTNGMLPSGTIDEEVRGNAYIIEYCYDTATVYGVFYTEGAQSDLDTFYQGTSPRNRDVRRNNDPIIGYYGGADAYGLARGELQTPVVSAGRSSVLAIKDPNLSATSTSGAAGSTSSPVKTTTLVTLTKPASDATKNPSSVTLMLSMPLPGMLKVGYVDDEGALNMLSDTSFCSVSGTKNDTYSLNLTQMKAHESLADLMSNFTEGEEYEVAAKCVTTQVICRPSYGYGIGVWPSNDEVIFTSNVIADYELTADVYVYMNASAGDTSQELSINLENWYNADTLANEDLYYRFRNDAAISIQRVQSIDGNNVQDISPVDNDYYEYPFEMDKPDIPHQVTFTVNRALLSAENTAQLRVDVYRGNTSGVNQNIPAAEVAKTLTITLHVMKAQNDMEWTVADRGSYFEVTVLAGATDTAPVYLSSGNPRVVFDQSSPLLVANQNAGYDCIIEPVPAGGSASIKFFKTDTSITNAGTFSVWQTS